MDKDLLPILDAEGFGRVFESLKTEVVDVFQRDKRHAHIVFLIDSKGFLDLAPFDLIVSELKSFTANDGQAKDMTFHIIASAAREKGCVGYFDVGEAWAILMPESSSPEAAVEYYQRLMKEHSGTLANVPTRMEILYVIARWRNIKKMVIWVIGRNGGEVWLKFHDEIDNNEVSSNVDRLSIIDRAIDDVISGKT